MVIVDEAQRPRSAPRATPRNLKTPGPVEARVRWNGLLGAEPAREGTRPAEPAGRPGGETAQAAQAGNPGGATQKPAHPGESKPPAKPPTPPIKYPRRRAVKTPAGAAPNANDQRPAPPRET